MDFKEQMINKLRLLEKKIQDDCEYDTGIGITIGEEEQKWLFMIHEMQEMCDSQKPTNEKEVLPLNIVSGCFYKCLYDCYANYEKGESYEKDKVYKYVMLYPDDWELIKAD